MHGDDLRALANALRDSSATLMDGLIEAAAGADSDAAELASAIAQVEQAQEREKELRARIADLEAELSHRPPAPRRPRRSA